MLTARSEMSALIETYGNYRPDLPPEDPENKKLLPRVVQQVASEFRNATGERGFGYVVAEPEDIFQRMVLKMVEVGVTVADLAHPDAQGKVRKFARNAARREVESARADYRTTQGGRVVNLTSFALPYHDMATDDTLSLEAHEAAPSIGTPDAYMLRVELDSRIQDLAEDIISKVPEQYRRAVVLYFQGGLTVEEVADETGKSSDAASKAIQRGRRSLHQDEVASLLGIRAYFHPEAKRPARMGAVGEPTGLLELLR